MPTTTTSFAAAGVSPKQRMEVLLGRLGELAGQRNAIDGEIVIIAAEIDRDGGGYGPGAVGGNGVSPPPLGAIVPTGRHWSTLVR